MDFDGDASGAYSADLSGLVIPADSDALLVVLLYDDDGSTTTVDFVPVGMGFTSDSGGAVFTFSGVLLHPQHLTSESVKVRENDI